MKSTTTQTPTSSGNVGPAPPWVVTVDVLASIFADAGKTPSAIRADIFKAEDRLNSRGERIVGNGLAAHGAVIRRGRKVLLDVHGYGNWLAGREPMEAYAGPAMTHAQPIPRTLGVNVTCNKPLTAPSQ